jgi:hypothetical protein
MGCLGLALHCGFQGSVTKFITAHSAASMFITSIVSARPFLSQTNAQLVVGCIHVICRGCAGHEEAKVPGEVGFACPFCTSECAIAADKLLLDVGAVAQLQLQQHKDQYGSGNAVNVPDCDVCCDGPATK